MINLIPKEEKKRMLVDFYCRFAVLLLLMGSFSVFVASITILPAYFFSSMKNSVASLKLNTQKGKPLPVSDGQSLSEVKDINKKLEIVENAEESKFLVSEKIISAIILEKTPNIKITQIVYTNNPEADKNVNILGTASSRETLLSFQQSLEDSPAFKNVNLPISNFIKGSNIQFNLSLTPQ
jgi:Fimbrial assembly protein (PilN)